MIPFVDLKAQYARLKPRIDARIAAVLEHAQFIMGPEVGELECQLAGFAGCKEVVSLASGTDALVVPMMARGIGPGDAVFVPTFTFTATAEVPLLLGATPVFVDVDPVSFNIDCDHLRAEIERVVKEGNLRPKAIVAVDLFGLPADWSTLTEMAKEFGLFLIDDAAQSLGGAIGERRIGSFGDVTATSFFPAKPFGGYGDGGAIFTDDSELAEVCRSIRLHGRGQGPYDIVRVGINGRLDTLQAAVLLVKLEVFEDELQSRDRLARLYSQGIEQAGSKAVVVPWVPEDRTSAWAQYTLRVSERDQLQAALRELGIPTAVYYPLPMHLQPAYVAFGSGPDSCPVSERLCAEVVSLPMHPYLADSDAERTVEALLGALSEQPLTATQELEAARS